ncbi:MULTISPECIES: ABC transporter substrate-binding protein [unclassified Bradyrhizobium]|uniref:ABC transporter substrate-binding protein n=1 Tax=unclassified Bradyrhizobium TaxID=2631580 RepID=UPI001FFA523E|nr:MULTISPECIES: ABC transporter substrate-binding protein [unclassified Bradyrhizobium]
MRMMLKTALAASLLIVPMLSFAESETKDAGDREIRIGNIMPYSGPLTDFSSIGKSESAYFNMINDHGGINGRKVKFITRDDGSNPRKALEQTRRLIDEDHALLIFGSFGTPGNFAVRSYLNENKIPQLFVASGDEEWNKPDEFPWTIGWQPSFHTEGRIYANYVQAFYPDRKLAVLWQNDQFGRDLLIGLKEGMADWARMIVADSTFDMSDKSIDRQIDLLRASGAGVLVFAGSPKPAELVMRRLVDINWYPVVILTNVAAPALRALTQAGVQNTAGVVSTSFLKDVADPAWKDDEGLKRFSAFMDKYYSDGDRQDRNVVFGYAAAETLSQVLEQCGDNLSHENIMRQATSLKDFQSSVTLPGIEISTGPNDFRPIKKVRLVQFDGSLWQPIGDVIDSAFLGSANR